MRLPVALLLLDVLRDRQALHHFPGKPGGRTVRHEADDPLALGDLLGRPDRAGRHMVQRRDDTLHARLPHIVDRDEILRPKPPPRLTHLIPLADCVSWGQC